MTSCTVRLDNPHGIFHSGSMLTGSVVLTLTETKSFRALYLRLNGHASCAWTEQETERRTGSDETRTVTVYYSGEENFLNQKTYLFGNDGSSRIEMPAGVTTYNFSCMLPIELPSTMSGRYGGIEYYCEAVLDRPWKFDKTFKMPFTVVKHEDLNLNPSLMIPSKIDIKNHFYCCCLRSKPFFMTASTPFTGYVPGQTIEVLIQINNQSNIDINYTKAVLERKMQFTSQRPRYMTKYEDWKQAEAMGAGVGATKSAEIRLSLLVPSLSPANLNSRVITINYEIQIVAKVSGAHHSPRIRIPIKIGTVPLQASIQAPVQAANYDTNYIMASGSQEPSAPPIMDLPPPNYDQAMDSMMEKKNEKNGATFTPPYPVFNYGSPQPAIPMPMPIPSAESSLMKMPYN